MNDAGHVTGTARSDLSQQLPLLQQTLLQNALFPVNEV